MTSSKIFKKGTFYGAKISYKWMARSSGLIYQSKKVKMSKLGGVLSKQVQLKQAMDEGLRAKPQKLDDFLEKQAILMPLDSIPHVFRAI